MKAILLTAAVLALPGCASISDAEHATHHPASTVASPGSERVDEQMKAMREMHQKMMAAKTLEERQALMAEHMKAMQGGMAMMCDMSTGGTSAQGGAGMRDMMKRCMEMKDMTMQMMMDRESGKAPATK